MLAVKRVVMQRSSQAYWRRVGWDRLVRSSIDFRRRRSIERKTAIFRELAPLASAKFSDADIARLVIAGVNPKNGYMWGYKDWRNWVRRHYR